MNDILPKPFTKEGLFGMLEVSFFRLLCPVEKAKITSGNGLETPYASEIDTRNVPGPPLRGDSTSLRWRF